MVNKYNKKNVIVGAADIYLADAPQDGEQAFPAFEADKTYNDTVASAAGWSSVGYTQEGLEYSNEPEYGDVEVDQSMDSARTFKTGQKVSINTTFAEGTLKNLIIAWGQSKDTLTGSGANGELARVKVSGGELGDAPYERRLIAIGNGPEKSGGGKFDERVYQAYRVLSTESVSFAQRRAEATVFPVSFRLLPNDDGDYGDIIDRVRY